MAEEPTNPDAEPKWFGEFKDQMGQVIGGMAQQQQQIAQQVQANQSQPAPAAPAPSKETDEKLLNELVNNPTRFVAELDQIITNKAAQQTQQIIGQAEEQRRQEDAAQRFEQEFFGKNPELMPYRALVIEKMSTQAAHLDPTARADKAADEVRGLLRNEQANAVENERRQRVSALRAGGAKGLRAAVDEGAAPSPQSELEAKRERFRVLRDANREALG